MPTETRNVLKSFNPAKLSEEVVTANLPMSPTRQPYLRGFDRVTSREFAPSADDPKLVGTSTSGGVTTEDWAASGELRFDFATAPTAQELIDLDNLLAAHDYTSLTAEQQREDQDDLELAEILAGRPAYAAHLAAWDGYNNSQAKAASKEMFTMLGKAIRRMIRWHEDAEI
jgi:hypothetical protein